MLAQRRKQDPTRQGVATIVYLFWARVDGDDVFKIVDQEVS
jgi:hypothetical protein